MQVIERQPFAQRAGHRGHQQRSSPSRSLRRCARAKPPQPGAGSKTPSRRSRRYSSAVFRQAVSEVEAASTTCGAGNGTNRYTANSARLSVMPTTSAVDRIAHGQLHLLAREEAGHQHLHQREAEKPDAVRHERVRGHPHVVGAELAAAEDRRDHRAREHEHARRTPARRSRRASAAPRSSVAEKLLG